MTSDKAICTPRSSAATQSAACCVLTSTSSGASRYSVPSIESVTDSPRRSGARTLASIAGSALLIAASPLPNLGPSVFRFGL